MAVSDLTTVTVIKVIINLALKKLNRDGPAVAASESE
jgi:hypothetical protein